MSYARKRYLTYLLITIFTLGLPFIKINGNHLLLLSFDKMQFHFLGFSFNMNELFLMPFLLMFLFIGIFAITSMKGRIWCGWACPQTIFRVIYRDLIESTFLDLRKIKNKQKEIKYNSIKIRIKKYISLIIWAFLCLVIASNFMWYFVPPMDFFIFIQEPLEHFILVMFVISIALFLFYDIVFMKENFCTYVCPYSRIQTTLYDDNTTNVIYNTNRGGHIYKKGEKSIFNMKDLTLQDECTTCEACVKVCPTNIDIRKGLQVECINCLECSDACSVVMGRKGKDSLISWSSTNALINKKKVSWFLPKNLVYSFALVLTIIFTIAAMIDKKPFLININKTTKLYKIDKDLVSNNYIITLHNRLKEAYTYEIEVLNKDFEVIRFRKLNLKDNQRVKTVLIIRSNKKLSYSKIKDTPLKLEIKISTLEDKDIFLIKDLSFIYPKDSSFK